MNAKVSFQAQPSFLALIDKQEWDIVIPHGWTNSVAGTGSVVSAFRRFHTLTGTTASSTALLRSGTNVAWNRGKQEDVLNWSKKIVIAVRFTSKANTTNGVTRFTFGKDNDNAMGALDDKGIGFQLANLTLSGIVHNGTTGASVDLSTALVDEIVTDIMIVSDGQGNVEWLFNGVSKGTSTDGPTGDGTANHICLQMEVENNADSAAQASHIQHIKIYVEQ